MMRLSPPYSPPYGVGQRGPRRGSLADVDAVGTYVPLPRALRALASENPYRTSCPLGELKFSSQVQTARAPRRRQSGQAVEAS